MLPIVARARVCLMRGALWVPLAAAVLVGVAPAQTPPAAGTEPTPAASASAPAALRRRIDALPDPMRIAPVEVAFVHPLYQPLDEPPRLGERVPPQDFETRATLFLTLHLNETGRVVEGAAVEPPLKGLTIPVPALLQRWRFSPAKKAGRPVATWATHALELAVDLEKPIFTAFNLRPVGKDDPLPAVAKEPSGEDGLAKYPREIVPPDPSAVSIEDVDVLPAPDRTPWSFDATRARSKVTALLEISPQGSVSRVVPTGDPEPLAVAWMKQQASRWRLSPAMSGGKAVTSWMSLDATLEYNLASVKKKSEHTIQKNLRGPRSD